MPGDHRTGVRIERLAPAEIDEALAIASIAYLPLGSLEFHGPHLPIGLDALNAHGVCVAAAQRSGGVVLPPIYQGIGGGHTRYPWTIMMPTAADIQPVILHTLDGLERAGVRHTVLFTGHFADEELAMLDAIASEWNGDAAHRMTVTGTGVNRCDSAPIAPDHAGVFETTLLHSLSPELVHPDRLPSAAEHPAVDPDDDPMGAQRHDPSHPLWGVFGPDPREVDLSGSATLLDHLADWLGAIARDTVA